MFIGRKNGQIYGSWTCKQPDDADHTGMEEVADDHPDLVAFLKPPTVIVKTPTLAEQILASPADLAALKKALGL